MHVSLNFSQPFFHLTSFRRCYNAALLIANKGKCKGEGCTTPTIDEEGNVPIVNVAKTLCRYVFCFFSLYLQMFSACSSRECRGTSKRDIVCGACGEEGHSRNNSGCPLYSVTYPNGANRRASNQKCGACGQVGHTKRSKRCPMYGKNKQAPETEEDSDT
jgi:hypothetical protein